MWTLKWMTPARRLLLRGRGRKKRKRSAGRSSGAHWNQFQACASPCRACDEESRVDFEAGTGMSVNGHADLGAIVDAIKIAPHREGKKRNKRWLDRYCSCGSPSMSCSKLFAMFRAIINYCKKSRWVFFSLGSTVWLGRWRWIQSW